MENNPQWLRCNGVASLSLSPFLSPSLSFFSPGALPVGGFTAESLSAIHGKCQCVLEHLPKGPEYEKFMLRPLPALPSGVPSFVGGGSMCPVLLTAAIPMLLLPVSKIPLSLSLSLLSSSNQDTDLLSSCLYSLEGLSNRLSTKPIATFRRVLAGITIPSPSTTTSSNDPDENFQDHHIIWEPTIGFAEIEIRARVRQSRWERVGTSVKVEKKDPCRKLAGREPPP